MSSNSNEGKNENGNEKVDLKIAGAVQDDVGKGIVRIDSNVLKKIDVSPGGVVRIKGDKETVAIADRAYPADLGLSIIRMDGLTRWNVEAGIGEKVEVQSEEPQEAEGVSIAPTKKGVKVQLSKNTAKQALLGRPLTKGDVVTLGGTDKRKKTSTGAPFDDLFKMLEQDMGVSFGFSDIKFLVTDVKPKDAVIVTGNTKINVSSKPAKLKEESLPQVTYEDIGGLEDEISKVREMVELPLKQPKVFEKLGIKPPKGVLLKGPPGTGKTLLARAVANESDAHFISIAGPEIMSKWVGEAEKKLRKKFEEAKENSPAIIFIDEIDAIASKREEVSGEVEKRVVAQLLSTMDGLEARGEVVVIAATNRSDDVDPALRRPGRFDREIKIGVPGREGREEILKIHTRNMPLADDVNLDKIVDITHGYVGADLEALSKESAMNVLRRKLPDFEWKEGEKIPKEFMEDLVVSMKDFKEGLKLVNPSALREVLIETPKLEWDDIGGLQDLKGKLKEAVEWPLKKPEVFERMGVEAPKGVMLTGPPGCGKTMLAKAVANESDANFISIKGPEVFSKWVGESEKAVRKVFEKARQVAPSVVFFDEIDALTPRRGMSAGGSRAPEQVVAQLLSEMDGLEDLTDVVVIAATNRPDIIDPALLRPGRFDRVLLVNSPDEEARKRIFEVHTQDTPLAEDVDLDGLAERTEGFSGADISSICREAAFSALREDIDADEVGMKRFISKIEETRPSLEDVDLEKYENFKGRKTSKRAEAAAPQKSYVG